MPSSHANPRGAGDPFVAETLIGLEPLHCTRGRRAERALLRNRIAGRRQRPLQILHRIAPIAAPQKVAGFCRCDSAPMFRIGRRDAAVIAVDLVARPVIGPRETGPVMGADPPDKSVRLQKAQHQPDLPGNAGARLDDERIHRAVTQFLPMRSHHLSDPPGNRLQRSRPIDRHRVFQKPPARRLRCRVLHRTHGRQR